MEAVAKESENILTGKLEQSEGKTKLVASKAVIYCYGGQVLLASTFKFRNDKCHLVKSLAMWPKCAEPSRRLTEPTSFSSLKKPVTNCTNKKIMILMMRKLMNALSRAVELQDT